MEYGPWKSICAKFGSSAPENAWIFCLFSVCFIQNTKSAYFVSEDYNRQINVPVKYLRKCDFIWQLSKHHEVMDYGDNAAADVVTTAADHLWRFV